LTPLGSLYKIRAMSQATSVPPRLGALEKLPLPETSITGLVRHFGPGMILMMTGIGTSHLVTAPVAGGRFEYALLWCIPVAYIFKYHGFEMAFRFTHATGRSMLDAYSTAWKKWPLWYVLVATLIQCVVGQAGRLSAAAAVLYYIVLEYFGFDVPIAVFAFGVGIVSVLILMTQRYEALEIGSKICAGLLVVSSVAVYVAEPAPLAALGNFVIVQTPAGSWLIIAAFLGLLPTGIDVSLQASEWGKAKRKGMGAIRGELEKAGLAPKFDPFRPRRADLSIDTSVLSPHAMEYCRRWFRIGEWDFRVGHFISFVVACIFLLLAAVWIYPSPVDGTAVIGEIGRVFSDSIGPSMMIVFLLGAFAATFSTAFNYFDGWPRVVAACARNLFRSTASLEGIAASDVGPEHSARWYSEYNVYRMTMIFSLVTSGLLIAGVPEPVWLVLVASALAYFVAPVIFFLNLYYCFKVIPKKDRLFYPSVFESAFAWLSMVVFTGMSFVLVMDEIFNTALFGA
jgi:Mn2+/Fe2+ NRAMP family transporter